MQHSLKENMVVRREFQLRPQHLQPPPPSPRGYKFWYYPWGSAQDISETNFKRQWEFLLHFPKPERQPSKISTYLVFFLNTWLFLIPQKKTKKNMMMSFLLIYLLSCFSTVLNAQDVWKIPVVAQPFKRSIWSFNKDKKYNPAVVRLSWYIMIVQKIFLSFEAGNIFCPHIWK